MNGMGFELEDLGGGSYAVNSVPAGLEGMNPVRLVQDMVSSAVEKESLPWMKSTKPWLFRLPVKQRYRTDRC